MFAVVVIALAVLVGVTQLVMPWLIRNPDRVETWLAGQLGRSVQIGRVSGGWSGGGPEITLDDVRIGPGSSGAAALAVPRAELAIDLFAPFQRHRAWNEFRLVGLDLALTRGAGGDWRLRGIDASGAPRQSMGVLGALVLKDLKLAVSDAGGGWQLALAASELRVVNRGNVERVLGKIRTAGAASAPFDLIADIDLPARSGRVYLGGRAIDLAQLPAHALFGMTAVAGRGDVQLWVSWSGDRVDDARASVDLDDATFGSAEPVEVNAGTRIAPLAHLDGLAFVARWQRDATGWGVDLADVVTRTGSRTSPPARLALHVGDGAHRGYRAAARDVALQPLGELLMLCDRLPAGLRRWLYLAHPAGRLVRAEAHGTGAADYAFDATLDHVRFADSGAIPAVQLASASLLGDAGAVLLQLPPQALTIDYPKVFRKPFRFSGFGGDVVAFRTGDAWRVATPRIVFEGEGYGGELRGHVDVEDDGSRPLLALYANVAHAAVPAAKLFWPINVMPPAAVAWLDRALVEGTVSEGRAAIRGDLDDWPFGNHAGRFVARARIDGLTLAYHPEWPRAKHVGLVADFVDVGLHAAIDGADAMGVTVAEAEGTIADLGEAVLDLSVKGAGSGPALLGFLRATPIGRTWADSLDGVAIGGKGNLAFRLKLPVRDIAATTLEGSVDLAGAQLDDARYDLHFADASGPVHFNQDGFGAGPLATTLDEYPVVLRLAAGDYVGDATHAFEASLDGRLPAPVVFARAPAVAPSLAHFPGRSDWHVTLGVDRSEAPAAARVRLGLRSDLVGTSIDLPAPLGKPAERSLPFDLDLDLPYEGQPFTAHLGQLLAVSGRLPAPAR
ncbi:MAG TPA: DUF3971 domain-containing protein, partial [Rhodanobacteraceae bacterium]|nr:DUF3971 domain-containing protein [Rhodanobacteraceae bacterium]